MHLKKFLKETNYFLYCKHKEKAHVEQLKLFSQIEEIDLYAKAKNYTVRECSFRLNLLSTYSTERQLLKKSLFYIHSYKSDKMLANQLRDFQATNHKKFEWLMVTLSQISRTWLFSCQICRISFNYILPSSIHGSSVNADAVKYIRQLELQNASFA